ncbi:hypothetical protein AJ79_05169 [Helicocarpus griseus UAMH5409]|uniref:Xylanolytic transcriptional activator regulatory domain-containing protein n=1 Tax=Helicocarpus griseus UAMH5409 TaxID=1447875 RepID=A0A2B7XGS4_9EURO|nr:hypothetical protein AJ79_05169 [Helicocarpus griseus UAMH5409]
MQIKCDLQVRGGQGYNNCSNCAGAGRECRTRPSKRGAARHQSAPTAPPLTPPDSSTSELTQPAPGANIAVSKNVGHGLSNFDVNNNPQHQPLNPDLRPPNAPEHSRDGFQGHPVPPPANSEANAEGLSSMRCPPGSDHASPPLIAHSHERRVSVIPNDSPATQVTAAHTEHSDSYPVDTGYSHVYSPEIQSDARNQTLQVAGRPPKLVPLPQPELQESFVETYYEFCYTWCPVLDRDKLPFELTQPLLVNALAVLGSHIRPPMIPNDGPATYYERARRQFYDDEEADVMISLKAISLFYWWSPRPPSILHRHSSWWWTSVIIRHCQQLGIHREPLPGQMVRQEVDRCLGRRIWWTAFARERLTALCQSKPCVIDPDDCSISEPTLEDFPGIQDITKAEIFIYWVRLCAIIGRIAKYLSRSFDSPSAPFPTHLGRELIDWVHSLPPHLQLPIHSDRTTSFNRDIHQLHLPYLAVIIILHLKKSSQPLPQAYPPAIFAASCVARILRDMLARGATRCLMAITGWYCGTAFIALLQACRIEGLSKSANEDLDILSLAVNQLRTMWPTANVFYHGFQRLRADAAARVPNTAEGSAGMLGNGVNNSQRPGEPPTEMGNEDMNMNMNIANGIDWTHYFPFATAKTSGVAETLLAPHTTQEMFVDDTFPDNMMQFQDLFEQYNSFSDIDIFM